MKCDDPSVGPAAHAVEGQSEGGGLTLPSGRMLLALPTAYFLFAVLAIQLSGYSSNIAAVWLGGAIVAAALLRHEPSSWPALLALAAGADIAANLLMGSSIAVTLLVAPLDMLEPLMVAAGMRRFQTTGSWYGSVRNISLLVFFIVAASAGVSLVGSLCLNYLGEAPFFNTWLLWAVADTLGLVIVTPFLLSWTDEALRQKLSRRKQGELVILSLMVGMVAVLIFTTALPVAFLIFPFLALLTLRTGLSGASTGVAILAFAGVSFTMQGMGPIARFPGLELLDQIRILQLYVFAGTLTTLPIAVILSQRAVLTANLARQAAISDAALENMAQGLSMFDVEQRLITCNSRYSELYGVPDYLRLPGTSHRELINHRMSTIGYDGTFEEFCFETRLDTAELDGEIDYIYDGRCIEIHRRPLPSGGWVATHVDVTERRAAESQIAYLASHDALTTLSNRASFAEQLEASIARANRGHGFALHTIDLDHFKEVNDTLGHGVGDQLLKLVAARLLEAVRKGDLVARLGGDEFAVLQYDINGANDASTLATRIVQMLSEPYRFDGYHVLIGATVGVALAPRDADSGPELIKKSDLALYKAKTSGRGTTRFFEPGMDALLQERRQIETELQVALQKGEFELYYQPILSLRTNSISGFEALIRWHHPARGLLQPADFITIAEETGLIIPIGEWVLREACKEAATWPKGVKLAVNLSSVQFRRGDLLRMVTSAVSAAGLEPERLELEVTETVILQDEDCVRAVLRQLRNLGISLAMDDFGTGYSSLSYLRSFPFNKIKIDRSFVSDLGLKGDSLAIVQATIGLAAKMGLVATAEGVETAKQAEALRLEGCHELQGYHIGRPLPAHQISRVIADFEQRKPPRLRAIIG